MADRWRYHPRVEYGHSGHTIVVEVYFHRRDEKQLHPDQVRSALVALAKGQAPNMESRLRQQLSEAKRRQYQAELEKAQRKIAEWQAKLDKAARDVERYRRPDLVRDAEKRGRTAERQLNQWRRAEQSAIGKLAPTKGKGKGGEIVLGAVLYGSHDAEKKMRPADIRYLLGIVMQGHVKDIGEEKLS